MRLPFGSIALLVGVVMVTACSSGTPETVASDEPAVQDPAAQQAPSEAPESESSATPDAATFTTGDLANLLLPGGDAPAGMKAEPPSLQTAYGSGTVTQNAKAAGYGFLLGQTQGFTTPSAMKGGRPKVGELGFYSLASTTAIYADAAGAAEHFDDPTPPTDDLKDYELEPLDVALGDRARRVTWREKSNFGGTVPFLRLSWVRGNARFSLGGYGVKAADLDEDALLALAQRLDEAAVPSGDPEFELPEFTGDGTTVLKDSFANSSSGWEPKTYTTAAAGYADGAWEMTTEESGLLSDAGTVAKRLADLDDVRIEFEATVESDTGAFGAVCRYGGKQRYYVASIGTHGAVNVGYVTGGRGSRYVGLASVGQAQVGNGKHAVRMDCVGDGIVRVRVELDGEVVAEGLDAASRIPSGAPGFYVEVVDGPVTATFDALRVATP